MSPWPIEPTKNRDEPLRVVMPSGRKPFGSAMRSGPLPALCLPFLPRSAAAGTATAANSRTESAMRIRFMALRLPLVAGIPHPRTG